MRNDLAHVDYETKRYQSMTEHAGNVAFFSQSACQLQELKSLVYLIGILHDAGKLGTENQKNFENILQSGNQVHRQGLDHSTAGGWIAKETVKEWPVSEFISTVIYFHHGIGDCINLNTGESLQEHRLRKEIEYDWIKEHFYQFYNENLLKELGMQAVGDYKKIFKKINTFVKKCNLSDTKCGNGYFYMGMYLRVALSLIIDGDWTDTACFFQKIPLKHRRSSESVQKIWKECIEYYERYLKNEIQNNPDNGNRLNMFRQEISDICREVAGTSQSLYRLTVPTGAGKTLSSLRFALHHAQKMKKQHIIYIAPFNSILEQNAQEIRKAVGDVAIVLEHHCNVICEEGEEERYRSLTESWDSPIIVTTAVQILNTLFSDQKSSIRRMHTLCNSVIIFDEVQAIPIKCIELFNCAVNFLSQFCNTTVVLCSATQPTLTAIKENNVCKCVEMSGTTEKYTKAFKRMEIIDVTELYKGGMEIEELSSLALEKAEKYQSVLVIVNTTSCALNTFQKMKELCSGEREYLLFHLSNNMCPQNKLDILETIKKSLKEKSKKIICISTQVVEAGVNFSFGCVIRSKAGLDNVIQAAGRCNRHKELRRMGAVFVVQMSPKAENLKYLKEIKAAQEALQKVLDNFRRDPARFEYSLDSEEAIRDYYFNYYSQLEKNETKFPIDDYATTMIDLLGRNEVAQQQYDRKYGDRSKTKLPQAFATAGKAFEVISNDYKISIVVPYNDDARKMINELSKNEFTAEEKRKLLRKLQRYTVGIPEYRKQKLGNAIYEINNGELLALCDGYYDRNVGIVDEPNMEICMI